MTIDFGSTPPIPYNDDITYQNTDYTESNELPKKLIQPLNYDLLNRLSKKLKSYTVDNISDYKPSEYIVDYIKQAEGFTATWKKDSNGKYCIGYGFLETPELRVKYPYKISKEDADKEFGKYITLFSEGLKKYTPNWSSLNLNLRDALFSYVYNIGLGNYTKKHPKLQKALAEKDWETAALNIDAGYNNTKYPGLRKRRNFERLLFLS